jgi:hypothetical protein
LQQLCDKAYARAVGLKLNGFSVNLNQKPILHQGACQTAQAAMHGGDHFAPVL